MQRKMDQLEPDFVIPAQFFGTHGTEIAPRSDIVAENLQRHRIGHEILHRQGGSGSGGFQSAINMPSEIARRQRNVAGFRKRRPAIRFRSSRQAACRYQGSRSRRRTLSPCARRGGRSSDANRRTPSDPPCGAAAAAPGSVSKNDRLVVNGVLRALRTGAPRRDIPERPYAICCNRGNRQDEILASLQRSCLRTLEPAQTKRNAKCGSVPRGGFGCRSGRRSTPRGRTRLQALRAAGKVRQPAYVRAPAAGTGARSGGQRQGPRKESAKNGSRSRRTARMVAARAAFLLSRARAMRRMAQVARSSRRKGTSPVRADETRQPASRPRFRLHEPAPGSRKTRRNEAPVPLSHFAGSSSAKPDALVLFALAREAVRQH